MSNQFFKIIRGTNYDKEVKKHFELLPRWKRVYSKVSELLGEEITRLAYTKDTLVIDPSELKKEENKKIFKKDGEIRQNSNRAKEVLGYYKKIIEDEGLSEFKELRFINFAYGVIRTSGQKLESFRTSENDIYYKANFDLGKKTGGLVEAITEIEYEEKYLEELKKHQQKIAG